MSSQGLLDDEQGVESSPGNWGVKPRGGGPGSHPWDGPRASEYIPKITVHSALAKCPRRFSMRQLVAEVQLCSPN